MSSYKYKINKFIGSIWILSKNSSIIASNIYGSKSLVFSYQGVIRESLFKRIFLKKTNFFMGLHLKFSPKFFKVFIECLFKLYLHKIISLKTWDSYWLPLIQKAHNLYYLDHLPAFEAWQLHQLHSFLVILLFFGSQKKAAHSYKKLSCHRYW